MIFGFRNLIVLLILIGLLVIGLVVFRNGVIVGDLFCGMFGGFILICFMYFGLGVSIG